MAFALKIFSINLYNTYYREKVCDDFDLVPVEQSQAWMERYRMKPIVRPGCLEVVWFTKRLVNPLQVLQEKMDETTLSFHMLLRHPAVVNCAALDIDQEGKNIYYFHNEDKGQKLHQKTYVSAADKIAVKTLATYPDKPGRKIFGIIAIHLRKLWEVGDFVEDKLPITYTIHIKARETIWRYCVVDVNQRIKAPMKVVLHSDDSYFGEVSPKETNYTHIYESNKPLALKDKPDQFFSLKTYALGQPTTAGKILIEKLPLPTPESLRKDVKNKKRLYNDIIVYV